MHKTTTVPKNIRVHSADNLAERNQGTDGIYGLLSRQRRFWTHHRATLYNVIGILEARITHFLVFDAIITHGQMHNIVSIDNMLQQFPIAFANSFFVFIN